MASETKKSDNQPQTGQITVCVRSRPNSTEERGLILENLDEKILIFDSPNSSNFEQNPNRSQSAGPKRGDVSFLNTSQINHNRSKSADGREFYKDKKSGRGIPSHATTKARGRTRHKEEKFVFDHVFNQHSTQEAIYEATVQPLIDKLFEGYNCSCFAYGATGAGKTFTMAGTNTKPGVMYRAVNEIYSKIKNQKENDIDVVVSFCEVYNEKIHDLLVEQPQPEAPRIEEIIEKKAEPKAKKSVLKNSTKSNIRTSKSRNSFDRKKASKIKEEAERERLAKEKELQNKKSKYEKDLRPDLQILDKNDEMIIQGLSLHSAPVAKELFDMLTFGNKNRTQHATDANAQSSRSHAIFTIIIRQREKTAKIKSTQRQSKLVLVDLAGSERAAKVTAGRGANRLREGANINKSLLALGSVINKLAQQSKLRAKSIKNGEKKPLKSTGFVNYRDSKLTRILKDVLGGNCFTVMIANVAANDTSYEDTYNTLCYARTCKHIRAVVTKSEYSVNASIAHYKDIANKQADEIELLKKKLKEMEQNLEEKENYIEELEEQRENQKSGKKSEFSDSVG